MMPSMEIRAYRTKKMAQSSMLFLLLTVYTIFIHAIAAQHVVDARLHPEIDMNTQTVEIPVDVDLFHGTNSLEQQKARKNLEDQPPAVDCLLADFDNDGRVGSSEIQQIKKNLHQFFDTDESGGCDTKELQKMVTDEKDVDSAFQKLDRDHDSIISLQELDERWEHVGAEMTVSEVADWVAFAVQLPQYAEIFQRHSISGYTFPLLMANDGSRLTELGIDRELHRQQLALFLKRKYLGMGKKPAPAVSLECHTDAPKTNAENAKTLVHVSWEPAENSPLRFQLQRRIPGEATWTLVYAGPDTEFIDVFESDPQHVVYRLAVWNSYGRSKHNYVHCEEATPTSPLQETGIGKASSSYVPVVASTSNTPVQTPSLPSFSSIEEDMTLFGLLRAYLWWLDEAIALTLFIVLPIRGFIYGDANYILKLMRRLPPNMPTRVVVSADLTKSTFHTAAVTVSWEKPVDNGVPIVCYCVRWTRIKTEEVKWVKLLTIPLPTTVSVDNLQHGETYKFVVEATNEFGLVAKSSRSTYMVPVPELKGKLMPKRSLKDGKVLRNQCHVCHDPQKKKKVPFTATLDRRILHFCCFCDKEFCHYHKGEVYHTKALSCPAVDGRCVCAPCKENRLMRSITY